MDKQHIWGDAVIQHPSGINASSYYLFHSDIYTTIHFLSLFILVLVSYSLIKRSLVPIVRECFVFSQTVKNESNFSLEQGRNILFIYSLLHFSMVAFFFVKKYDWRFIPLFFITLILYYGLKYAIFTFIGWVVNHSNELKIIAKSFRDYLFLSALVSFPIYFATLFFWPSLFSVLVMWSVSSILLCYFLFLYRTLQYFLHYRFSVFFFILYLCSFEVAPFALLYSLLLTV